MNVVGERNPRGIPSMVFIDSVVDTLAKNSCTVEALLESLQTMHSKYKLMERHLVLNKNEVTSKIPEIEKSLNAIEVLMKKQETGDVLETHFGLADNVYAEAIVKPIGTVCLWLGANVMLEYSYEEAKEVLSTNMAGAERKIGEIQTDLDFIREALITTEVNIARVFNHDVKTRREAKAAEV